MFDYDGGDGGEGPFSGADEVGWRGDVAEGVGGVWDGEVLGSLSVSNKARL